MNVIKKIQNHIEDKQFEKDMEYYDKYFINEYETIDKKYIWGIISYDDVTGISKANFNTMTDLDLIYHKDEKKYSLSIETSYMFNENGQYGYMQSLLDEFTIWMVDNNYNINRDFPLFRVFTNGININTKFDTIEETYAAFKLLVNGFCSLQK